MRPAASSPLSCAGCAQPAVCSWPLLRRPCIRRVYHAATAISGCMMLERCQVDAARINGARTSLSRRSARWGALTHAPDSTATPTDGLDAWWTFNQQLCRTKRRWSGQILKCDSTSYSWKEFRWIRCHHDTASAGFREMPPSFERLQHKIMMYLCARHPIIAHHSAHFISG